MKKYQLLEVLKFTVRIALLVFTPQLIAYATGNPGPVADILSVVLPILDKWVHESNLRANGLVPF